MAGNERKQNNPRHTEGSKAKKNSGPSVKGYPPSTADDETPEDKKYERRKSGSEGSGQDRGRGSNH